MYIAHAIAYACTNAESVRNCYVNAGIRDVSADRSHSEALTWLIQVYEAMLSAASTVNQSIIKTPRGRIEVS